MPFVCVYALGSSVNAITVECQKKTRVQKDERQIEGKGGRKEGEEGERGHKHKPHAAGPYMPQHVSSCTNTHFSMGSGSLCMLLFTKVCKVVCLPFVLLCIGHTQK